MNNIPLPGFEPEPTAAASKVADAPAAVTSDLASDLASVATLPFAVHVTRSRKRRRSVGAQLIGGTLRLAIPSWMSKAEEAHWIDEMSRRFIRKMSTDRFDLDQRAVTLARRFDLPRPRDIRWATDMTTRWGSCTPANGTIRISDRLAAFPDWVVDYVIVHELAHLEELGHTPHFWQLVHRFPTAERAIGYLMAKSGDDE